MKECTLHAGTDRGIYKKNSPYVKEKGGNVEKAPPNSPPTSPPLFSNENCIYPTILRVSSGKHGFRIFDKLELPTSLLPSSPALDPSLTPFGSRPFCFSFSVFLNFYYFFKKATKKRKSKEKVKKRVLFSTVRWRKIDL